MSIDARHMALLNEYLMSDSDYGNVTNGDNSRIFNKILDGDYASSMFDYLTNCGSLKLNDIISMQMFNSANMAAVLGAFGAMDEIVEDRRTVLLPKKQMKVKCRLQEALRRRCSTRSLFLSKNFFFRRVWHACANGIWNSE